MWIFSSKPPLFWEPVSGHPISVKLTAMKAALASGADPNELDHEPRAEKNLGRPLHLAIEYTSSNLSRLHENLPVVELLLQHGADPRLGGMQGRYSPLEDLRRVVAYNDPTMREAMGFFKEVLEMMEVKARELDGMFS